MFRKSLLETLKGQRVIQEGEESLAHRDRIATLSDFPEAERLEPADCRPHLQLSSIYAALGRERDASEEYEWAVPLNPDTRGNVEGAFTLRKNLGK